MRDTVRRSPSGWMHDEGSSWEKYFRFTSEWEYKWLYIYVIQPLTSTWRRTDFEDGKIRCALNTACSIILPLSHYLHVCLIATNVSRSFLSFHLPSVCTGTLIFNTLLNKHYNLINGHYEDLSRFDLNTFHTDFRTFHINRR